jgi:hypothetical protein
VKRFKSHHWFSYFFDKSMVQWVYLYRAVDSHGDTLDFMLSEHRDEDAATAFFKQAINNNGFPGGATEIPQLTYTCDRTPTTPLIKQIHSFFIILLRS